MMRKSDKNIFYCFSPFVMIATFFIEISLALYVFIKYKLTTPVRRTVFALLLFLAAFQLVEFQVCQGHDQYLINVLSRIGILTITFLPPLGMHLSSAIVRRKNPWYVYAGYILAGAWAVFFVLFPNSIVHGICGQNYAIIKFSLRTEILWGIYYLAFLFVGVWEAYSLAHRKKFKKYRASLYSLVLGYLVFMIPAGIIVFIHPPAQEGLPSIMCGFALILAVILTFLVLPEAEK